MRVRVSSWLSSSMVSTQQAFPILLEHDIQESDREFLENSVLEDDLQTARVRHQSPDTNNNQTPTAAKLKLVKFLLFTDR